MSSQNHVFRNQRKFGESIIVAWSPTMRTWCPAPRKNATFAERKATVIELPIPKATAIPASSEVRGQSRMPLAQGGCGMRWARPAHTDRG